MKRITNFMIAFFFTLGVAAVAHSAEHGGSGMKKEHGGSPAAKEHGGAAKASQPSSDDIRNAMKAHVMEQSKASGTFDVADPETGKTRKLEMIRVHERVGKTGNYYYSCADFKDTESGEMLDLDLDVEEKAGALSVVDVRIHKVGGKERYTYDATDNRIPVKAEGSHKEHGGAEGSHQEHEGSHQEHGGKEHGGK